jgi:hypothetical protein
MFPLLLAPRIAAGNFCHVGQDVNQGRIVSNEAVTEVSDAKLSGMTMNLDRRPKHWAFNACRRSPKPGRYGGC